MSQALGFALSALVFSSLSVSAAETEPARTSDAQKHRISASAGNKRHLTPPLGIGPETGIHALNPTLAPNWSGDPTPYEMSGPANDQRQCNHSKSSMNSVPSSATRTGSRATPASPLPSSPWPL